MGEANMNVFLKKGAEASLYLTEWHSKCVVIKRRLPKKYRPEQLDERIRRYRTIHEPQLMHEAKRSGVPTPIIFMVDVENATIIMEYIDGPQVKNLIDTLIPERREALCRRIGAEIAKLHRHGIIHGDLTTSNMILGGDGTVYFVDFGLGDRSTELEAYGVDLHLLKRALQSTHFRHANECFTAVLKGYSEILGTKIESEVCEKIREIEKRGRYVAERQTLT